MKTFIAKKPILKTKKIARFVTQTGSLKYVLNTHMFMTQGERKEIEKYVERWVS